MSLLTDNMANDFASILADAGEVLTYGATQVAAIVNRDPAPRQTGEYGLDKADDVMSEIELPKTALPAAPVAGKSFIDSTGKTHRVTNVRTLQLTYRCYCQVS